MPPVGFLLVTHNRPAQTLRLVDRLARLYGPAPVVIHHDQSQSRLDPRDLPAHVHVLEDWVKTRWGDWGVVEGTLRGLRRMLGRPDSPDWTVLLSGADYPVARPERVLADLAAETADVRIDCRRAPPPEACDAFWRGIRTRYGRGPLRPRPWLPKALHWRTIPGTRLLSPFRGARGERTPLYFGSQWFTIGRRAAEAAVAGPRTHRRLTAFMRFAELPDEAYVHNVVATTPGLTLSPRHARFIKWNAGKPNPETLTSADLPAMLSSGDHFARKFDPLVDAGVLDELDRALGLPAWDGPRVEPEPANGGRAPR